MIRSRVWLVVVCAGFSITGGACGGSVSPSSNPQQNVMVIDDGIDPSVSDLQGKVVGTYTESCATEPSSDAAVTPVAVDSGAFDTLKQVYLQALAQPDDSCHLTPGISSKPDPLAMVAQFKSRWNEMVRKNETVDQAFTYAEYQQLMGPLSTEFDSFGYHGTATSSTVAHDNSSVRLVLVERQLGSEESLMTNFPCLAQSDIDQTVELLSDPQIYAAAVAQPATVDGELAAAMSKYDVGIVNESFGASSRQTLETLQTMYCKTPISLSAYFTLIDSLTNAHNATIGGPPVLTVQAGGNDGVQIDSGADSLSCDLGDPNALLVGAYDSGTLARTSFSDYGGCIDLYAPGQAVVVEYAGGWLVWADGTSFASPLTVRYASMAASVPHPFAPSTARTAVLAATDPSTAFLPVSLFPSDFFYQPATVMTDFAVPVPLVPRPMAAPPRPLSEYELHRILAPIERLKRLRGR
ncbi:MAG TPA: S8/S53 family peptidase [Polyangia bacterium]